MYNKISRGNMMSTTTDQSDLGGAYSDLTRVPKNSAEQTWNGFHYSVQESDHSEVYGRVDSEARNGMT